MLKRRDIAEKVFDYIKSIGFKVKDIQYGDGYFVFDMGDDGVIHFKIKGLRKWKFAMWINTDAENLKGEDGESDYPALQFFCQYEENIDKFKPSRSYFLAKYGLDELEELDEYQNPWFEIKHILEMIKRHPFVSYVADMWGYCGCPFYDGSYYMFEYIKGRFYCKKCKIKDWCKDWIPFVWSKLKILFFKNNPIIESVELVDLNNDEWECSPRFDLRIQFKKTSTKDKEIKFLNKWFKKDRYGNLRLEYGRVGIEWNYTYIFDERR